MVVSGLHKSYCIADLKAVLAAKGHIVRSATVMQKRVFDRASERMVPVYLDRFIIHLEPRENNKDIYSVKDLDHSVVNIEPPHRRKNGPAQCKHCQGRGHTANFCYGPSVCVKCAGQHHTSMCTMDKSEVVKCANCGGNHTANYAQIINGGSVPQHQEGTSHQSRRSST